MPESSTTKIAAWQAVIIALITSITSIVVTYMTTRTEPTDTPVEYNDGPIGHNSDCTGLNDRQSELAESLKASDLYLMNGDVFEAGFSKPEIVEAIRRLLGDRSKLEDHKTHYLFDVYLMQRILLERPRHNINTRTNENDEAYPVIQRMLRGLNKYVGPIDGNRVSTNQALERFQKELNTYTAGFISEENYGIFGNRTLQAIINQNRISSEAK